MGKLLKKYREEKVFLDVFENINRAKRRYIIFKLRVISPFNNFNRGGVIMTRSEVAKLKRLLEQIEIKE